ncbi:MAG TPA: hypothetical protein VKM72_21315 [Thermoanaerobaculia bacterium]|nr:hypothetical protein [Thermoanaerobaculia bacterium]
MKAKRKKPHLALVEVQLEGVRDLLAALAERYPSREPPMIGLVEDALRHLRDGVRIIRQAASHRAARRYARAALPQAINAKRSQTT